MKVPPIRHAIVVSQPPADAFRVFTEQIGRWWPIGTHSISQGRARGCAIEARPGGAVYEVRDDGVRLPWGRVLVWEPPTCLVLSWHPGRDPAVAQEVEVRFSAIPDGTLVELEHRGWEALGEDAPGVRDTYSGGWPTVFEVHFAKACAVDAGGNP